MPSIARAKPRKARARSVCICGHIESVHREPLDAYTGTPLSEKRMCRFRVPVLEVKGRQRISVVSPCPCSGFAASGDFTEV